MTTSSARSRPSGIQDLATRQDLDPTVRFEPYGTATPETASQLISLLAHWPYVSPDDLMIGDQDFVTPFSPDVPSDQELAELRVAADLARTVGSARIEMCSDVEEAIWQSIVNLPMLQPFLGSSFNPGDPLVFAQDALWTAGHDRFPYLSNPKPDVSFGLAFANEDGSPLSSSFIKGLVDMSGIPLTYCPTTRQMLYPSIIVEAKSSWQPMKHAENQLALSATRALTLLAELSKLSEVPFQHCVVLVATQGSFWRLFVAYQDLDARGTVVSIIATPFDLALLTSIQHIVPVLRSVLRIELNRDRQQLAFMINRLKTWMLGPYRAKISEQLIGVRENGQRQLQPISPAQRRTSSRSRSRR